MSNTSQLTDCITTSNDIGIIAQEISTVLSDTITLTSSDNSYYNIGTTSTVTLANSSASMGYTIIPSMTISSNGNVGIGTMASATFNWNVPNNEWEDRFPEFYKIKAMCEQYPGLKIAYEKFVTTYKLVKDDYDNPRD